MQYSIFLAFIDSFRDGRFFYGDSIWIYKDWNNDDIIDVNEYYYLILEYKNKVFLRANLSDIGEPFEKYANVLTFIDNGNYWQTKISNSANTSFYLNRTHIQIYSNTGILKFDERIKIDEGWEDRKFLVGNSTYHIYGFDFEIPYENSTNGSGKHINSFSLNHPEIWEGCIFVYIDQLSDEHINTGDYLWLFKDWNDDNINDVLPTDLLWIFDHRNCDMIVKII